MVMHIRNAALRPGLGQPLDLSLFAPIPLARFIGGGQSHAEQSSDGVACYFGQNCRLDWVNASRSNTI